MGVGGLTVEAYTRAVALFGEQLREVTDEQWDEPTPCTQWSMRQLVAHVVVGESQVPVLLGGGTVSVVHEVDASVLGSNPLAAWRGTALAAIEAFSADGALETVVDHPLGTLPGRQLLGFRLSDNLVHAWDLARSRGEWVPLPDELAETALEFWLPMATELADTSFYGPMLEPPVEATAGERLLALLGRRPRP